MLTNIEIFENFGSKLKFVENYNRYQDFIFFHQNRDFSKILIKIEMIKSFRQNHFF